MCVSAGIDGNPPTRRVEISVASEDNVTPKTNASGPPWTLRRKDSSGVHYEYNAKRPRCGTLPFELSLPRVCPFVYA